MSNPNGELTFTSSRRTMNPSFISFFLHLNMWCLLFRWNEWANPSVSALREQSYFNCHQGDHDNDSSLFLMVNRFWLLFMVLKMIAGEGGPFVIWPQGHALCRLRPSFPPLTGLLLVLLNCTAQKIFFWLCLDLNVLGVMQLHWQMNICREMSWKLQVDGYSTLADAY